MSRCVRLILTNDGFGVMIGIQLNKQIEKERDMIPMAEIGWIAGFLEGEGYFTLVGNRAKSPRIEAGQVDTGPIDRLYSRFGGKVWQEKRGDGIYGKFKGNRQPFWRWYCPPSESIQIMMTIYSLVSTKRRLEIEYCIEGWKSTKGRSLPPLEVCKNGHILKDVLVLERKRPDGKGIRKLCGRCLAEGLPHAQFN